MLAKFVANIHKQASNPVYVLPGGSTPILFYQKLAQYIDNWIGTSLLLSDERMVDGNQTLSNSYHIKKHLMNNIKDKKLPEFFSYNNYITADFQGVNPSLNKTIEKIGYPTLAILGLGDDGHTASLFPNNRDAITKNNQTYIIVKNQYDNFLRISLTFDYLMKASQIILLISGKEKSHILDCCLNKSYQPIKWPVQYLFKNYNKEIIIYCDSMSASEVVN